MAVAVRLVEALTLVTVLGVLMACTVLVVIAERVFRLLMYVIWVSVVITIDVKSEIFARDQIDVYIISVVYRDVSFQPVCASLMWITHFFESILVYFINVLLGSSNGLG